MTFIWKRTTFRKSADRTVLWLTAVVALAFAFALVWMGRSSPVETAALDPANSEMWRLDLPSSFATSSDGNDQTAFREEDAGFSAYFRVPESPQGNAGSDPQPRIDIRAVTVALLDSPNESNSVRTGPGRKVDLGSNFAIIEIPMFAAFGFGDLFPERRVTVYLDDRGWVVAYLPAGEPAAGIWRHDSAGGETDGNRAAGEHLELNLLVLAVNEVLDLARVVNPDITPVTHSDVGYYDWQNPECDAFLLFSNETSGGPSEPINFVIPPAINAIQASAGVLITSQYSDPVAGAEADVALDGQTVVAASAPSLLSISDFGIVRPTAEDGGYETSLHKMIVSVSEGETATGVMMLLYDKPGS